MPGFFSILIQPGFYSTTNKPGFCLLSTQPGLFSVKIQLGFFSKIRYNGRPIRVIIKGDQMGSRKITTKIIRTDNGFALLLPDEIISDTPLEEGSKISISRTKPNTFELKLEGLEEGKVSCQICGQSSGKYTCQLCGIVACPNCFWELGKLCKNCMKNRA